jgi:hypothetical protein
MNAEIVSYFKAALECSIFIRPAEPGLSYEELRELGRRLNYQDGEIGDAIHHAGLAYLNTKRVVPGPDVTTSWVFYFREEPELRNLDAFDFVVSELNERVKADGVVRAQLERSVIAERAFSCGIPRDAVEAAILYQVMAKSLIEKDGFIRFSHNSGVHEVPSKFYNQQPHHQIHRKPRRARVLPIVKDIIARRADGRPRFAEPLDAFADELEKLNFGMFRLWWTQTVAELRRCEATSTPLSAAVLSAALVEGALTFVVKHARSLKLEVFRSKDFDGDPRGWKIDDLIKSAASGSGSAVLDQQTRARAETLCRTRQRIHAGRMLSEYPGGVPDLRPDEARDAKAIAEQVVRCVLDWLQKYPAVQLP